MEGPGAPKFLLPKGLSGLYLSSKLDVPMVKNVVRGWLLSVKKIFSYVEYYTGVGLPLTSNLLLEHSSEYLNEYSLIPEVL